MSFFDDQEDAWFDNNCQGNPDEYNPYGERGELLLGAEAPKSNCQRNCSWRRKEQRKRAKAKTAASDEHKGASL